MPTHQLSYTHFYVSIHPTKLRPIYRLSSRENYKQTNGPIHPFTNQPKTRTSTTWCVSCYHIICVSAYIKTPATVPYKAPDDVGGGDGKVGTLNISWTVSYPFRSIWWTDYGAAMYIVLEHAISNLAPTVTFRFVFKKKRFVLM